MRAAAQLGCVSLALLLSACASRSLTSTAQKIVVPTPGEQTLLARYPDSVRRQGNILRVKSRAGWLGYEERSCQASSDCVSYSLDRAFLDGRLFGINVTYYEGSDYIVADTHSGHECTGGSPIFSPDGKLFAVSVYNEAYESCSEGVTLWQLEPELRKIRTISPQALTYPEHLRWRGSDCLGFTAVEGEYNEANRRAYYLLKAEPEWRLGNEAAAACDS
jgi:hypothetical protein